MTREERRLFDKDWQNWIKESVCLADEAILQAEKLGFEGGWKMAKERFQVNQED